MTDNSTETITLCAHDVSISAPADTADRAAALAACGTIGQIPVHLNTDPRTPALLEIRPGGVCKVHDRPIRVVTVDLITRGGTRHHFGVADHDPAHADDAQLFTVYDLLAADDAA